ncbi:MAG TPA: hypothetical protein PK950_02250 [Candidatus Paceibacterota bacterium]|nr:hypothetical protein [Candidatus Paceibacterota bacterium]
MVVIKLNKKEQAQELAQQISETVVALAKLKRKVKKQINGMYNALANHFDRKTYVCKIIYNDKGHFLTIELKEPKNQQVWIMVEVETELHGKTTIHFRKNLVIKNLDLEELYDANELVKQKSYIKNFLKKNIVPKRTYLDVKSMQV